MLVWAGCCHFPQHKRRDQRARFKRFCTQLAAFCRFPLVIVLNQPIARLNCYFILVAIPSPRGEKPAWWLAPTKTYRKPKEIYCSSPDPSAGQIQITGRMGWEYNSRPHWTRSTFRIASGTDQKGAFLSKMPQERREIHTLRLGRTGVPFVWYPGFTIHLRGLWGQGEMD